MGSAVSSLCLIRSRLIPIDIHSKNFLLQNKALQKREAPEIRMSFLVLKKVAEIFPAVFAEEQLTNEDGNLRGPAREGSHVARLKF